MDWSWAASFFARHAPPSLDAPYDSPPLTLSEVRESGLPAVFLDFGEALLYLDGQLFCLRDGGDTTQPGCPLPSPLPAQILISGVGLEYGWRHVGACSCPVCWGRREQRAA